MLNASQIQAFKAAASKAPQAQTGGIPNGQSMTPEQIDSWAKPESAKTATSQPADLSPKTMLGDAFSGTIAGAKQTASGASDFVEGLKKGGTEGMNQASAGALRTGAGVINTALSPVSNVINNVAKLPVISNVLGGVDNATKAIGDWLGN